MKTNENVCLVFQRPLACINDPRVSKSAGKQIISAHVRLGATDWTRLEQDCLIRGWR